MNVIITPNERGGWSIVLPNSQQIGNYATAEDARTVATQNGWEAIIECGASKL